MLDNIEHIKTNFEFIYKSLYNGKETSLEVEKQILLKRANSVGFRDGGYGYSSYHLELKLKVDEKLFKRVCFLDETGNYLFSIRPHEVKQMDTFMKINLIDLPLLVLEDTKTIQFEF